MRSGVLLAVVLGGTSGVVADTIHVPEDYPTIQAAILAALEGDEIIVAPGTYNEAIFFNGHNIILRSESGPEVTTIDATGLENSVVRLVTREGPSTVIDGFTITGGVAAQGGGIYCLDSNPTINNCIIRNNIASNGSGGGLWVSVQSEELLITQTRFVENSATLHGGGVAAGVGPLTFRFCLFQDNFAVKKGGGLLASGSVSLVNCSIIANGVSLETGTAGGAWLNGSVGNVTITNCSIAGNRAWSIGGLLLGPGPATMTNCIAWANTPNSLWGEAQISYSNIESGWPGCDFCILADPLFVNPDAGNFRIGAGSPCIDLGNNTAVPKGIDTDLDGAPRFMDDPDTNDCPQPGADCGIAPIVDMGTYEFQPPCQWDLDTNGSVGVGDLLILLANWGNPYGVPDLLALLANWGPCP